MDEVHLLELYGSSALKELELQFKDANTHVALGEGIPAPHAENLEALVNPQIGKELEGKMTVLCDRGEVPLEDFGDKIQIHCVSCKTSYVSEPVHILKFVDIHKREACFGSMSGLWKITRSQMNRSGRVYEEKV
jgi:hypothetical protein